MALISPFPVIVLCSSEFEPSIGDTVVGESFPIVPSVKPPVDVVLMSRSSGSRVGAVLLGVVTAVVIVVVIGGSVAFVELVGDGDSVVVVTITKQNSQSWFVYS